MDNILALGKNCFELQWRKYHEDFALLAFLAVQCVSWFAGAGIA
jgi:hypothetical protein